MYKKGQTDNFKVAFRIDRQQTKCKYPLEALQNKIHKIRPF